MLALVCVFVFPYWPYVAKEGRSIGKQIKEFVYGVYDVFFIWDVVREAAIILNPCSWRNRGDHALLQ